MDRECSHSWRGFIFHHYFRSCWLRAHWAPRGCRALIPKPSAKWKHGPALGMKCKNEGNRIWFPHVERVQELLMVCNFHPQECSTCGSTSQTGARKAALVSAGISQSPKESPHGLLFFMTPTHDVSPCPKFPKRYLCATHIPLYHLNLSKSSLIRQDPIRAKRKPSIPVFAQPLPEVNPNFESTRSVPNSGSRASPEQARTVSFTASLSPAAHPSPSPKGSTVKPMLAQVPPTPLGSVHHTHPQSLFPPRPWRAQGLGSCFFPDHPLSFQRLLISLCISQLTFAKQLLCP